MKKNNIVFISSSRSDLDLISVLIKKFISEEFNVGLVICGTHLYKSFGETFKNISDDLKNISYKIRTNIDLNKKNLKLKILNKFNFFLNKNHFDYGIILGDRFESYLFSLSLKKKKFQ